MTVTDLTVTGFVPMLATLHCPVALPRNPIPVEMMAGFAVVNPKIIPARAVHTSRDIGLLLVVMVLPVDPVSRRIVSCQAKSERTMPGRGHAVKVIAARLGTVAVEMDADQPAAPAPRALRPHVRGRREVGFIDGRGGHRDASSTGSRRV